MLQLYIYLFLHKIFHINVKPKVEMCISQNHYITPFLRLNKGFNIIVLSLCRSSHHIHYYTWLYPSLLLHFKSCTPRSPVTHPATSITKELAIHNELTRMSWLQSSTTALNAKVTQTIPAVIQRIEKQILKHTQHGLLFPAHIHRQQIPATKKAMAATIGKIIGRLPFFYIVCYVRTLLREQVQLQLISKILYNTILNTLFCTHSKRLNYSPFLILFLIRNFQSEKVEMRIFLKH